MFRTVAVLATLAACALAVNVNVVSEPDLSVRVQDNINGGLDLIVQRKNTTKRLMHIARNVGAAATASLRSDELVVTFANDDTWRFRSQQILGPRRGYRVTIEAATNVTGNLQTCLDLGSNHWYGGPQQKRQLWPIEKLILPEFPYVTQEADNCGIAEPYWLGSDGTYFIFDKIVPLFVDQNVQEQNTTCFTAKAQPPYSRRRDSVEMYYVMGFFNDVREAHEDVVENFLEKPTGYPDEKMIKYPIWSTWARYKTAISHDVVLAFADEINRYNFPNSQFQIDDLWETCYGSLTVDVDRFPNMANTVSGLKSKGFRVTMWVHPFINKGCEPWYTDALNNGYLVLSEDGSEVTSWWNANGTSAAYVDYTKPAARKWYNDRVQLLRDQYGIDSFKFDGGESSWSPQVPVLQSAANLQPSAITTEYVRSAAQFGPMVEVRTGSKTQDLPIFVRMISKDSDFTFENGLPTLITTLLQMNINGYTLVLPDMIGGNGYNDTAPSKELFIRWLQANVFMPSMQFSYVPWDYDAETVQISRELVALHERYAPDIVKACQRSVADGSPVNAPLWWIAPEDTTAHAIWDEFLLGEDIIAAPVVTEGATTRDIYLPAGSWLELGDPLLVHEGPKWIRNYPAPLNVLPYFVRDRGDLTSSATTPCVAAFLVLLGVIVNIFH